ncbi:MAG TPA: YsnF/AvaK domain-containing protein [Pyrinomonadaceae bacterium]
MAEKRAATNRKTTETGARTGGEKLVIPVIAEEISVDKKIVESGRVRISKRVSEREEIVDVPLFREEVRVERVPINLFVEAPPAVRQEGDTMIIPVVEEQVVIQKKFLLVEELRVRKEVVERHEPQTVNLRKEEVEIKRVTRNRRTDDPETGR